MTQFAHLDSGSGEVMWLNPGSQSQEAARWGLGTLQGPLSLTQAPRLELIP